MSERGNSSGQEWPRRNYLRHAGAEQPSYLSPIPEQEEPPCSPPPSPLPELVVEVDRNRYNRHDESEEYYKKLEIKMLKYYRKVFFGEHTNETFDYEDLIPTTQTPGNEEDYDVYAFVDDVEPSGSGAAASGVGDDEIRSASSEATRHIDDATFSIHEDTESTQNVEYSKSCSAEDEDDAPISTSSKNIDSSRSQSTDAPDSTSRNRHESTDELEENTDSETSKFSRASRLRHIETEEGDRTTSNTDGEAGSDAGLAKKYDDEATTKLRFSNSSIDTEDDNDTVILSNKSTDSSARLAENIGKPNVSVHSETEESASLRSLSVKNAEENSQNEQAGVISNDTENTPEIMRSARAEFYQNTSEAEKDTSKSEEISFHGNIERISQIQERQIDMEHDYIDIHEPRRHSPIDGETTPTSPILGKRKSTTASTDCFGKKKRTVYSNRDRSAQTSVHFNHAAVQTNEVTYADASTQTEAEANRRDFGSQTDAERPNFWFCRGFAYFYMY